MKLFGLRPICYVLALTGCKTVHTLDAVSKTDAATAAEVDLHEVKSTGPEHIVMTVEEYEQLCPSKGGDAPEPDHGMAQVSEQRRGSVTQGVAAAPGFGPLIRRTVTVTDRGPSLDDLRSLSSLQSKVNTALEVKEEKKSGPAGLLGLLGGLWPVVLIGGAILAFTLLKPARLGLAWRFVAGAAKAAFGKKAP